MPTAETTPLTARSVLLSLLLGNLPPRAPVRQLVRTAALFGIAEGTARTALSRLTAAGEVTGADGWYEITAERLLARQRRQLQSREATTSSWTDGRWVHAVVVVTGTRPAADRARLREQLRGARLAELREGVWLRPDNLDHPAIDADEIRWFRSHPVDDPAELAARLWDLSAWANRADELIARMAELVDPLEEGAHEALAPGFVASADVLRQFQADPLLPAELLPRSWPGARLRLAYDRYDASYRSCLARYFRDEP